jgi:AcrR family transcriptional regulator
MPRPSLKEQRTKEILEAYMACIARHGLEGATQDRIAAKAGLKRSIIRHYVGNKEDMVIALTTYLGGEFNNQTLTFENSGYKERNIQDLINLLFSDKATSEPTLVLVYQALIFAVDKYPGISKPLLGTIERLAKFVSGVLSYRYPQAAKQDIDAATYGLVVLHLNYDTISPLSPPKRWRTHSYDAAVALLASLGKERKGP